MPYFQFLINQFFEVTEKYVDILMAIKAYFTKDIIYFQETFDLITMDEKIQTPTFIQKIIKSLNNKKIVVDLMNRINDMEKCNQKLFENLEKLNQANSAKIISLQKDNLTLKENNKNLINLDLSPILKTNIIRRFISKGKDYEFMNYILFVNDEMYIYPPEAFNNTHIFLISK